MTSLSLSHVLGFLHDGLGIVAYVLAIAYYAVKLDDIRRERKS